MVMLTGGDGFVLSPSDLTATASCEFGWLRNVDTKLGRIAAVERKADAMMERTAVLGDVHEVRVLDRLRAQHEAGVVELAKPQPYNPTTLADFHDQTIAHLKEGVDVLFQGVLFDGGFGGMADFIVRQPDGTYQVQDAKLARSAKVTALLQIAAYADLLDRNDVPRSRLGALILGDQSISEHDLDDVIPVYRHRRAQLEQLLGRHLSQDDAIAWNSPDVSICGSCDWCLDEIERHRDLLLVAGLARPQRVKLRAAGIETIEQLADSTDAVPGMSAGTLAKLRLQAELQVRAENGEVAVSLLEGGRAIKLLPEPTEGDVFFDFEGDPLWTDNGTDWGLEYLWGVIEPDADEGVFRAWWAHDRVEEKAALIAFLDYVVARRAAHPGMHVYHYAPYEITALKKLVARHATHEDVLDDLLRANVFVDLYATVRRGIRVGTRSYSIKKLEPLYMGETLRTGLDNAADSIAEYQRYCDQVLEDSTSAQKILDEIADYNEYDCVSTWRLRDWLSAQVASDSADSDQEADPTADLPEVERIDELAPVVDALLAGVPDVPSDERTHDQQALAMLAASLGYHRRERKSFWWSYFERLVADVDEWPEPRDCFVVDEIELMDDWHRPPRAKSDKRRLRLTGRLDPATRVSPGGGYKLIYDEFPSGLVPVDPRGRCVGGPTTIEDVEVSTDGRHVVTVIEAGTTVGDVAVTGWDEPPMGLCVGSVIATDSIEAALQTLARLVLDLAPALPTDVALDLLRRVPPRLRDGGLSEVAAADSAELAILDSVRRLDRSYLAVQGPPGTGKTYVGSHVVKQLVESGWKVGVVAQSHAVVCNFLAATVKAGLEPAIIAKPKDKGDGERPWLGHKSSKLQEFIADADGGCLVGGTAWTFTNRNTVGEDQLDLLVIDEAGQFSLANTLAAASAAARVMLLGDPQQLPQVSQGTHPEPVDESALSWVANGHATMPATHGYFLERTWRMHSALTEVDSHLSYEGRLRSETSVTDVRELTGVEPGVHPVAVHHVDNDVRSSEEAEEIVRIVRSLKDSTWRESATAAPRPTTPADALVVAPYNSQVTLIREFLDAAGLTDTRVGTVDKFQGQEAPVVIVSMTASSAADVPRGLDFLLNRNRLNVAISRGQWAAYVVHSPVLCDVLPTTAAGVAELGAFLGVVEQHV